MSLGVCLFEKNLHLVKVGTFVLDKTSKCDLKDEHLITKQTYMKTEAKKLYSGEFEYMC